MTPESEIKKQILEYLALRRIYHWVHQAGKIPGRRLLKTGISDILGIYNCRFLAIEVKAPKGTVSAEQKQFLYDIRINGGIAFVARSVEDVVECLNHWRLYSGEPNVGFEY